jgi:hypothetical protein
MTSASGFRSHDESSERFRPAAPLRAVGGSLTATTKLSVLPVTANTAYDPTWIPPGSFVGVLKGTRVFVPTPRQLARCCLALARTTRAVPASSPTRLVPRGGLIRCGFPAEGAGVNGTTGIEPKSGLRPAASKFDSGQSPAVTEDYQTFASCGLGAPSRSQGTPSIPSVYENYVTRLLPANPEIRGARSNVPCEWLARSCHRLSTDVYIPHVPRNRHC